MSDRAEDLKPAAGVPARRAVFYICVFYVGMLLFNGVAMYESAQHLEYGRTRDFWVAVLSPVAHVSRLSGLCCVRRWTQETFGEWLNDTAQSR